MQRAFLALVLIVLAGLVAAQSTTYVSEVDPDTVGGAAWGAITGTLSDQTDLQTALDGKEPAGVAFSELTGSATGAQLPNPGASSKGGVQSLTCSGTDKLSAIGTDGVPVCDTDETGAGGGLPSGLIVLSITTCPSGFTEVSALSGKFVLGTTDAAGDVTDTGGSDTITDVLDHTHTVDVTDPGHTHTQDSHNHTQNAHGHNFLPRSGTTGSVSSIVTGTLDTSSTISGNNQPHVQSATATNQAATATNQSNTTGITATTANPASGVASLDNRPAYVKVIFCSAD